MRRVNLLLLAVVGSIPLSSAAQHDSGLVGRRVRVRAPLANIFDDRATVIRWERDSIVLSIRTPVETRGQGGHGIDPATLTTPTRVKVWAPDFHLESATVEMSSDESGVMQVCSEHMSLELPASAITRIQVLDGAGQPVALPRAAVESLDLYAGRKSGAGIGSLFGALLGVGAGVLVQNRLCNAYGCEDTHPAAYVFFATAGGAAGALVGLAVGAAVRWDNWERVPSYLLKIAPIVTGTEFGFAAAVSF
jgi:hypothetical protein